MKKKIFNQKIKVKVEIKRKKDKIFNEDIDNIDIDLEQIEKVIKEEEEEEKKK